MATWGGGAFRHNLQHHLKRVKQTLPKACHIIPRFLLGSYTAGSASFMSPPPYNGLPFFRRCLLGAFLSKILTKIKVLDGTLRYCVARSQRPTTTTSILRPIRSQFYIQFDLNFTSNSTSILRPIRSQFYNQFDLNCRLILGKMSYVLVVLRIKMSD